MKLKRTFFRKKKNKDKILFLYKKWFGYPPVQVHYDNKSKFWWLQVEGNRLDPFPSGRWRRADWFFEEIIRR